MELATFNLNNEVRVKLKPKGIQHANEHELDGRIDSEGYLRIQMWEFMRIFGSTLAMGTDTIFEMDIKIDKRYIL